MQPPVSGLPWPAASQTRAQQLDQDGGSGAQQLQRLSPVAPPRLARPPADLWFVSAGGRAAGVWSTAAAATRWDLHVCISEACRRGHMMQVAAVHVGLLPTNIVSVCLHTAEGQDDLQ
jgi:hypothetical protein